MAVLPLESGSRKELLPAIVVPLLAMGVPLFDTLLAIWRRTVRALLQKSAVGQQIEKRIRVMQPDKEHLHHRVLQKTMNQRNAAWVLYGISAFLVLVALLGVMFKKQGPGIFLLTFIIAVVVIVRHLVRVELWDTGRLLSNQHVAIRKGLITPLFVLFDLAALTGASLLAYWTIYLVLPRDVVLTRLPIFVVSVFVMLVLSKTYLRVWSRTSISDFSYLIGAILLGALVGSALSWLFYGREQIVRFVFAFTGLATVPILGVRLLGETLRGAMNLSRRRTILLNENAERILVYGAGTRFRNYLRSREAKIISEESVIVGIIDDHLEFFGRVIYNYEVLGNIQNIPELCKTWKVTRMVLTCNLPHERLETLLRFAKEGNIKVSKWTCVQQEMSV
jgi:hypothetical protein